MEYPIDEATVNEFFGHLITNIKTQANIIKQLSDLLENAMYSEVMSADEGDEAKWFKEAEIFLNQQHTIKIEHENRKFDEDNLRKARGMLPKVVGELPREVYNSINIPGEIKQFNTFGVQRDLDKMEESFGEQMSEEELASHFNERPERNKQKINLKRNKQKIDLKKNNPFKGKTLEEIREWERQQDNSNDIYKIKARIANLAREGGASLTPVGEMLCNSFVHVIKDLYDFAETIEDKNLKIQLIERIRRHESMPGTLIAATTAGVRKK